MQTRLVRALRRHCNQGRLPWSSCTHTLPFSCSSRFVCATLEPWVAPSRGNPHRCDACDWPRVFHCCHGVYDWVVTCTDRCHGEQIRERMKAEQGSRQSGKWIEKRTARRVRGSPRTTNDLRLSFINSDFGLAVPCFFLIPGTRGVDSSQELLSSLRRSGARIFTLQYHLSGEGWEPSRVSDEPSMRLYPALNAPGLAVGTKGS